MLFHKVFSYPRHEMILECTFDDLMEEVRGDEFVDICSREIIRERLWLRSVQVIDNKGAL